MLISPVLLSFGSTITCDMAPSAAIALGWERCISLKTCVFDPMHPLLHDIIEDTETSICDLQRAGFTDEQVDAVYAMTKQNNEDYDHYLARVKANPIARVVKLADLTHNTDPTRQGATPKMLDKYNKAKAHLLSE